MLIDTGDHPPIAMKPYTLAIKHHEWVKEDIDKLLETGVIRESPLVGLHQYLWYQRVMVVIGCVLTTEL